MSFVSKLWVGMQEARAVGRQAILLPRDALSPVIPRGVNPGDDVVVFLHGLFASAGVLRPMRLHVDRFARTAALSYPPGPGIEAIGERLRGVLDALPSGCFIHLVGHSMGGIVSRYHAVRSGDDRIVSTIALASPFGGVRGLASLGFEGARDLATESGILRELRLTDAPGIPHLSILAEEDGLTRTPISHALPSGEVTTIRGVGHNTILFHDEAIAVVAARIREVVASRLERPKAVSNL